MAISPIAEFPGKVTPASAEFPFGKAQNITLPGDGTGTPWDSKVVNDVFGFQQALLDAVNAVPSGTPDEVGASQYLDAVNAIAQSKITRLNPATLSIAINDPTLKLDDALNVKEHTTGNGGGGTWDLVLLSSVTVSVGAPAVGNIVAWAHNTGAGTDLALSLRIEDFVINVRRFGATGKKGVDQTAALQVALDVGQTLRSDNAFIWHLPTPGDYEATHLTVDRSLFNRNIVIFGNAVPGDISASVLRLTDTTQSVGFEWDGGFIAYRVVFDFSDARSVGTLGDPRWTIDVRNVSAANDTADIDVEFIDCTMQNTHRGLKLFGRGFKWDGGLVVNLGGAVSEGCLLDLDFPNPLVPGSGPDQTLVTGMRSYRILAPRVHACTGHLVRNKGSNANNLYQMNFNDMLCDTTMGLMRGAICNVNVNGGTWLSSATNLLQCDATFDFRNVTLDAPSLLGMPETNIGQSTSGGPVLESEVDANAQGVIVSISPGAGIVENFNHIGGDVADVFTDCYQIGKAIDGFILSGVNFKNVMKENKEIGGTKRHVVNFLGTASTNVIIEGNTVNNTDITYAKIGELAGEMENVEEYVLSPNLLSGSVIRTVTRPKDSNFGGDQSGVFCGRYTGEGGDTNINKFNATSPAKSVMVQRIDAALGNPNNWMAIDGETVLDVRLNNGILDCRQNANVTGIEYAFTMWL
jgi:hypothetical protein